MLTPSKQTVYYVFDQATKTSKMILSGRNVHGQPLRTVVPETLTPSGSVLKPPPGYTPREDGGTVVSAVSVDLYTITHLNRGDRRHVALLEVLPGGLCHVAAP